MCIDQVDRASIFKSRYLNKFQGRERLEQIFYADISSPIDTIWAASTRMGLFQLEVSRTKEVFLAYVGRRIRGQLEYDPDRFDELKASLKKYFDGEKMDFELPLDLRGTGFQMSVWRAIQRIPYGKISSYGRLAMEAGRPRAVRVAGNAVGDNPISIVIPCHRVIRSDGSLGGYGGGLDVKRYLLRLEGVLKEGESSTISALEREYPMNRDDLLRYWFE